MARVKRGTTTHARHKKVLEQSKGFVGRSSTNYRIARERLEKSLQYAYRDRRVKKREFRGLWIQRINAAVREHGITYSQFICGLKKAGIEMDRKVLAAIAYDDAASFAAIVQQVQAALGSAARSDVVARSGVCGAGRLGGIIPGVGILGAGRGRGRPRRRCRGRRRAA